MNGSVLEEKLSLKMLGSTFSSKLDWDSYIISVAILYCYSLLSLLQKRICRTVGPSLAAALKHLAHHRNLVSLSLFYSYHFVRCSSELAQLVPLRYSQGRSSRYSDSLQDFSVTIPRCYKDVCVNSFFPRTTRFWHSLTIECFPLTYDLNCQNS